MEYKVIVSKGNFSTTFKASIGEKEVDWRTLDNAKECIECFLAYDFKDNIEKIKKDKVEIIDISEFNDSKKSDCFVVIGKGICDLILNQYAVTLPDVRFEKGGYKMMGRVIKNKNFVFLYGDDFEGTRNAVCSYMERLGLSFISPGISGTYYNENKDLCKEKDFDVFENPSYKTRGAFSSFINNTSTDFFLWMFHNKLNFIHLKEFEIPEFMKKLCLNISAGGHDTFYKYMDVNHEYPYCHKEFGGEGKPSDPYPVSPLYDKKTNNDEILTYGKAHPEWFAEVDGVRRCFRDYEEARTLTHYTGDYICTSNEDGTNEIIKLIIDALSFGEWKFVDYFNLWAMDNGTWCDCEKCRKDSVLSYRQLMFAYKLDKAIKKARQDGVIKREIKIIVPAYHETLEAPDKPLPDDFDYNTILTIFFVIERCYNHFIDDECCKETNTMLTDYLKPWFNGFYKGEMMIGEYYNVSSFSNMPFILTKMMAHDIPYYYNNGSRHLHYMHFCARNWGVFAVNNFLYCKLLWDVNINSDEVLSDYYYSRYKEYAPKMEKYYRELEIASANCKYIKHYQYINKIRRSLVLDVTNKRRDILNCNHIHFSERVNSKESGLSLTDTKERFANIFRSMDAFLKTIKKDKLWYEDLAQVEYGYYMIAFMFHIVEYIKATSKSDKIKIYEELDRCRHTLEGIEYPLLGYDKNLLFVNGLIASKLDNAFFEIKKEIANEKLIANKNSKTRRCPTLSEYYRITDVNCVKDRGIKVPHWHHEYEFLLFTEGSATHVVNSIEYKVKKGDVALLSPSEYHLFLYEKGEQISYKRIRLKSFFFDKHLKNLFDVDNFPYLMTLSEETYNKLIKVFEIFESEYEKSRTVRNDLMCTNCIIEIGALLGKEKHKNIYLKDNNESVKQAMTFIHKNFNKNISVKDVADAVNYSQNYLSVLFIKTLGISCKNYIMDIKLDYAYNLIMQSDASLTDICYESGFNSLAYFSNAFKLKYGSSPKQFIIDKNQK